MIDLELAATSGLSSKEFHLLAILALKEGGTRRFKASIAEIQELGRVSSERTCRRLLKALEGQGWISRERTKAAGGLRGVDTYIVVTPNGRTVDEVGAKIGHTVEAKTTKLSKSGRTTHGNVTDCPPTTDYLLPVVVEANSNKKNTTCSLPAEGVSSVKKEKNQVSRKESMRRDYDDGEDLAGVGSTEPDEVQPQIKKNDPKTRGRRPNSEWTPGDVAAEFSFLVGKKYPWLPGTVNVYKLSRVLAKYRKDYQTSALIELELLRLFMANDRNFKDVGSEAPYLYKKFLASFRTNMGQARSSLGLPNLSATLPATERKQPDRIRTSDGKEYDNSMSGRMAAKKHEERIRKS